MRTLGLDLGERRIGVAISDEAGRLAFPDGALESKGLRRDLASVCGLIEERGVRRVVVGLPLHMDGRAGAGAERAERFAAALRERTGLPVATLDERWTSLEAERSLRESGGGRRKKKREKGAVDAVAASIILRTYLEREAAAAPERETADALAPAGTEESS